MTSFLHHIIDRHTGSSENVKPRIQSTFDHENFFSNDPVINDREEGEETEAPKKEANLPGIEITGLTTDVRKTKKENKIPDVIVNETVSQVTEPVQPIKPRENNSESQQESIKQTPAALLKKDTGTGENKQVSFHKRIISKSQKQHTEGSLDKTGEKINEQKNKIASPGSLPALTEINEPVNDDEIKPGALKDNGSTNVSPWRADFKNKTGYPLPKISSATTSSQTINISIDRIEIRAQFPQAEPKMISKKEDKNILSLDQYIESRKPR